MAAEGEGEATQADWSRSWADGGPGSAGTTQILTLRLAPGGARDGYARERYWPRAPQSRGYAV